MSTQIDQPKTLYETIGYQKKKFSYHQLNCFLESLKKELFCILFQIKVKKNNPPFHHLFIIFFSHQVSLVKEKEQKKENCSILTNIPLTKKLGMNLVLLALD